MSKTRIQVALFKRKGTHDLQHQQWQRSELQERQAQLIAVLLKKTEGRVMTKGDDLLKKLIGTKVLPIVPDPSPVRDTLPNEIDRHHQQAMADDMAGWSAMRSAIEKAKKPPG